MALTPHVLTIRQANRIFTVLLPVTARIDMHLVMKVETVFQGLTAAFAAHGCQAFDTIISNRRHRDGLAVLTLHVGHCRPARIVLPSGNRGHVQLG